MQKMNKAKAKNEQSQKERTTQCLVLEVWKKKIKKEREIPGGFHLNNSRSGG